jgi:hypothetical protein
VKVIYFLMALEPAPLTWLEGLPTNTIDTWDDLKKAFFDNFLGSQQCLATATTWPSANKLGTRVSAPTLIVSSSTSHNREHHRMRHHRLLPQ